MAGCGGLTVRPAAHGIGFSSQALRRQRLRQTTAARRQPRSDSRAKDVLFVVTATGRGAAGFELDRLDHRLAAAQCRRVASSEADRKDFVVARERLGSTRPSRRDSEQLIRRHPHREAQGGASSVGSITYCGSLPQQVRQHPRHLQCQPPVRLNLAAVLTSDLRRQQASAARSTGQRR